MKIVRSRKNSRLNERDDQSVLKRPDRNVLTALVGAIAVVLVLSGNACASTAIEKFAQSWRGVPATFTTYDQQGLPMDEIHGVSFRITRDERFDFTEWNSDGSTSTRKGDVLLVSVGDSHVSHVGSSACLRQDGIEPLVGAKEYLNGNNDETGLPWINDMREKFQNLWAGKSKTILIRSQDGRPISVYAGNNVEVFTTDVAKSTWFRIDGKMLWCYRVDYTMYDNDVLTSQ